MEYGNYMMIVKADGDGVLDHKYSDIKSAYDQGCLVVWKMESSGVNYLLFLMVVDESVEDAYTVVFMGTNDTFSFTSETVDGYPVIDEGDGGGE